MAMIHHMPSFLSSSHLGIAAQHLRTFSTSAPRPRRLRQPGTSPMPLCFPTHLTNKICTRSYYKTNVDVRFAYLHASCRQHRIQVNTTQQKHLHPPNFPEGNLSAWVSGRPELLFPSRSFGGCKWQCSAVSAVLKLGKL